MLKFFSRWWIFSRERFPLGRHALLIIFYVCANALVAFRSAGFALVFTYREVLCAIAVLFIFFHLRIFDEIKDYKNDLIVHKERPLARGLIGVCEARRSAAALITLELYLVFFISRPAFSAALFTVLYSLIMYKEFFIGKWLRPKMTTYALAHTLVACWMSVLVFSAVTGLDFWKIPRTYAMFVLVNWMIFNIFEFGRKTFGKEEERQLVESYSKRLGSIRAALNIVIMATVAVYVAYKLGGIFSLSLLYSAAMYLLYVLTLICAGLYAVHNDAASAKILRGVCSVFILFYNVIITLGILWRH